MDDERIARERRPLDPDGPEDREFLAARVGCANRQAARESAEILAAGQRPEKARPLEDRNFGEVAAVGRLQNAEAGKTDVRHFGRRRQVAEIEQGGIIGKRSDDAVFHEIDLHRRGKDEAAMQRLDGEAHVIVGPDRGIRLVLDLDVLVVGQRGESIGQRCRRRLEGLFCKSPRHVGDVALIEWRWRRGGGR